MALDFQTAATAANAINQVSPVIHVAVAQGLDAVQQLLRYGQNRHSRPSIRPQLSQNAARPQLNNVFSTPAPGLNRRRKDAGVYAGLKNEPESLVTALKAELKKNMDGPTKGLLVAVMLHKAEKQNNPKLVNDLITASLQATSGAERAHVMVAMVKQNPANAAKLATMDPKLTSLQNADLRSVGQDMAMIMMPNVSIVGATLPSNLNLSKVNTSQISFDGVIADGIIFGPSGVKSAVNAKMRQNTMNAATADIGTKGADTGFYIAEPLRQMVKDPRKVAAAINRQLSHSGPSFN